MSSTTILTVDQDVVLPLDGDQVVSGTAATLTAGTPSYGNPGSTPTYTGGDRLDGGAGYDVLSLTGSGSFNLQSLGQFTGFEEVRVTNTTSNPASLILRDGVDLTVTLSDGNPPPASSYPTFSRGIDVTLGTGLVTLSGGNGSDIISASAADKLRAGSVIDGGAGQDMLRLSYDTRLAIPSFLTDPSGSLVFVPPVYGDTVYDLTSIGLSHVENLFLNGNGSLSANGTTIAKVDTAALADVTSITAFSSVKLVTAAATLDLTGKSVSGAAIESSNASGTTFTTNSVATAQQVRGGSGQDTLVVSGLTLTGAQRDQIFAGSIETLTDASGTYTKTALPAGTTVLTAGQDVVLPLDGDQVVSGTAATLTSGTPTYGSPGSAPTYTGGDRLDGGAGHDVLSLTGSGSFDLQSLGQFTGFEEVRLTNTTGNPASLTLRDGVDLTVTLSDGNPPPASSFPAFSRGIDVTLGTGLVTLSGGNGGDVISASAADKLRAGSVIDGGAGQDMLTLFYEIVNRINEIDPVTGFSVSVPPVYRDTVYDLTSISLSHVETLALNSTMSGSGKTSVKVDNAALADVANIFSPSSGKLVTAAAALDLTNKVVMGVLVESSNATGTTFTTNSVATAQQVRGGSGQDTLVVSGLTLTGAQRDQIFAGSIETLTDASGTYTKTAPPAATTVLIGTADGERLVVPSAANWTVNGLGGNDTLVGGAGNDLLDGGAGIDTVELSGRRGDYSVTKSGTGITVRDLRSGSPDGTDEVTGIESVLFKGGQVTPNGTIQSGFAGQTLQGTGGRDVFLFDTALGLTLGADTIRSFGAGDRLVTTSKIFDGNDDGRITSGSDRFLLPDAFDDAKSDTGSVKLVSTSGQTVKALVLTGTTEHDGVTYYSYAAAGDTVTGTGVSFGGGITLPTTQTYIGTSESDSFTATPGSMWTIDGLGGDDTLTGAERRDTISGGDGADRLAGAGGNDVIDGGAGIDTAVFAGRRGDYSFVKTHAGLVVTGSGTGSVDGADTIKGVEAFVFLGGSGQPKEAITSTHASETRTGTAAHDTFYFDTDAGLALGADTIVNFGDGDRLVTTSKIFDGNNDGIISVKAGASFTLPGTSADQVNDAAGSVKLLTDAGQAVSNLKLFGTDHHDGVTYYTYAALGDPTANPALLFA